MVQGLEAAGQNPDDGRAAGVISEDAYANGMKTTNKDIAECVRRSQLLGKL